MLIAASTFSSTGHMYLKTSRYMLTIISVTLISIFNIMNEIALSVREGGGQYIEL